MAKVASKKAGSRSSSQDRARVAGKQRHEVGYAARKSGKSRSAVKKAVKKVRQQPEARGARSASLILAAPLAVVLF